MATAYRRHPLDLRVPPPLIAGASAFLQWLLTRDPQRPTKARRASAVALVVTGATIGARGLRQFQQARTTFHPHHPESSTTLVTTGVYSRTRNPMYLGMAVGLLGIAVFRGQVTALLPILAYAGYLQRFQIRPEERALSALFGEDYEAYTQRVRRWI